MKGDSTFESELSKSSRVFVLRILVLAHYSNRYETQCTDPELAFPKMEGEGKTLGGGAGGVDVGFWFGLILRSFGISSSALLHPVGVSQSL